MSARLKFIFSLIIAFSAIFLFLPSGVLSINFLQNDNFESGSPDPWESSGGGSTATISSELVHSGGKALKVEHSKTGSYGFQQTVRDIEGGMFYRASGFGATEDSDTSSYFLRTAWYESSDGSGSQLSSPVDSNKGERTDSNWVWLELVVQAPLEARSAKVRIVLNSKESGVLAHAYFDDISFEESVAPSPTPESKEEDEEESTSVTLVPTPTLIFTPTPTKKPTPTKTLTPTPIPSGEILGEEATPEGAVSLNDSSESTPSSFSLQSFLPFIFVGLGGLLLAIAAGSVLLPILKKKYRIRKHGKAQETI